MVCPKCGAKGKYYYEGTFIECEVCHYRERAKKEKGGHITNLWEKWNKKEVIQ